MGNLNPVRTETVAEQLARIQAENDALKAASEKRMEQLEAENAALRQKIAHGNTLRCKQSPKGGVSVYGLQRMPVTLYAEQWIRLFRFQSEIDKFIRENTKTLSYKKAV